MRKGRARLDLVGQKFGRLTVTAFSRMRTGRSYWMCKCDCGNLPEVGGSQLKFGTTTSCGCAVREINAERCRIRNTTHGMKHTPEHKVWDGMIQRCSNANNISYARYGGRGITVCDRWRAFEAFYADMGPRPSPKHSIERIDNDRGYEPGNVKWATSRDQANNRRNNHRVEYLGRQMTLREAIRLAGDVADKGTVHFRIERLGWPVARAVETASPTWNGETGPVRQPL